MKMWLGQVVTKTSYKKGVPGHFPTPALLRFEDMSLGIEGKEERASGGILHPWLGDEFKFYPVLGCFHNINSKRLEFLQG